MAERGRRGLNNRHRRVLEAVFEHPTRAGLAWADIEGLLQALGCSLTEGRGSRVRFHKGEALEIFHRPHPGKEAKRYQVELARTFIRRLGVEP